MTYLIQMDVTALDAAVFRARSSHAGPKKDDRMWVWAFLLHENVSDETNLAMKTICSICNPTIFFYASEKSRWSDREVAFGPEREGERAKATMRTWTPTKTNATGVPGSFGCGAAQAISLKVALFPRVHLFVVFSLFCIHVSCPWDAEDGSLSMHQLDGCRLFVVPVHLLFDAPELGSSRLPSKISHKFRSTLPTIR